MIIVAAKSLDSKCVGRGWGQSQHLYNIRYLAEIVLSLIYSQLFRCLVSRNKKGGFYFDKNSFNFLFISVLYRIVIEKALPQIKISNENV